MSAGKLRYQVYGSASYGLQWPGQRAPQPIALRAGPAQAEQAARQYVARVKGDAVAVVLGPDGFKREYSAL